MEIIMVVALFAYSYFVDYRLNKDSDSKKERILYLSMWTISFIILLLYTLNVKLPSISRILISLLKNLFGQVE